MNKETKNELKVIGGAAKSIVRMTVGSIIIYTFSDRLQRKQHRLALQELGKGIPYVLGLCKDREKTKNELHVLEKRQDLIEELRKASMQLKYLERVMKTQVDEDLVNQKDQLMQKINTLKLEERKLKR